MFSKDMTWQGERDGVGTPKDLGEGTIHPSERPGGSRGNTRAKGARGAVDGLVIPFCWEGETCAYTAVKDVLG